MPTALILNQFNNYVTDDAAKINFGCKYDLISKVDKYPDGPLPQIKAINAMKGDGAKMTIPLGHLTLRHTIKGGVRNPDAKIQYTTDYQTYHLYSVVDLISGEDYEISTKSAPGGDIQFSRRLTLVIVSVNGAGNQWMVIDYCDRGNSILHAALTLPPCVAHDMLNALFSAYENGYCDGYRQTSTEYKQAFVDGRLKKRKNRGESSYKVFIEDKPRNITGPIAIKIGGPSAFD